MAAGPRIGALFSQSMTQVTDITLREIERAVERVTNRRVQISSDSVISRDLEIDSLALMNVVMELEDAFDLSIPLDRLAAVETAGDLSEVIHDLRSRG